jgi:hypothetical protein
MHGMKNIIIIILAMLLASVFFSNIINTPFIYETYLVTNKTIDC